MHRYWPTIFPEDYEEGKFDIEWRKKWSNEIPHSVKVANYQLQKLIDYCDITDSELIVCSSMGQGAVREVEPIKSQVLIVNLKSLLSYIGVSVDEWRPKLSMAPLVVFEPKSELVREKLKRLSDLFINGKTIKTFNTSTGEIRLNIKLTNQSAIDVFDGDKKIDPMKIGVANVNLQDASGSYAYHIPEGILLHYKAKENQNLNINRPWTQVSALDFAPSLLKKFEVDVPNYMKAANLF